MGGEVLEGGSVCLPPPCDRILPVFLFTSRELGRVRNLFMNVIRFRFPELFPHLLLPPVPPDAGSDQRGREWDG